ncbi:hypothetical protein [Streptomyces sp. NPDC014623]|uniref:hypothetical protein n=1 Tax=Streptomyces sp. NPDC014623 TaxID=3364875 RepID=UPI0036FB2287
MSAPELRDLAAGLRRHAVRSGKDEPTVAGADWRMATVATVSTSGTITTTDGITARRAAIYEAPQVGDRVQLARSSSGSWVAEGRLTPTSGDGWTAPALASPWSNFDSGYQSARYRLYACGDVVIEGVVGTGATSVTGTSALFTLPAGCRPTATQMVAQVMNGNTPRQLTINNLGQVRFVNLPAGAISFITINARYSTL